MLYRGCILFNMHSFTILLTCFNPLNEPIEATEFPCASTNRNKLGLYVFFFMPTSYAYRYMNNEIPTFKETGS